MVCDKFIWTCVWLEGGSFSLLKFRIVGGLENFHRFLTCREKMMHILISCLAVLPRSSNRRHLFYGLRILTVSRRFGVSTDHVWMFGMGNIGADIPLERSADVLF